MSKAKTRPGGAQRKHPDGLTNKLFVRIDDDLKTQLERYRDQLAAESGIILSVADVVRYLLGGCMVAAELKAKQRRA